MSVAVTSSDPCIGNVPSRFARRRKTGVGRDGKSARRDVSGERRLCEATIVREPVGGEDAVHLHGGQCPLPEGGGRTRQPSADHARTMAER